MAVGAGVSWGVKTCVISAACTAGASVLAATAIATAAAGLTTGLVKIGIDNHGNFVEAFNRKNRSANLKKLAFHTGFTMLGGALFNLGSEYGGGVLGKVFNFFSGSTDTAAVAPTVVHEVTQTQVQTLTETSAAVTTAPLTGLDKVADIIAHDNDISDRAKHILEHARRGNPQALKDLGFFLFNGRDGFPVDRELAVDLFHQANDLGHGGAGVDLAYTEYHGLGHVPKHQGGGIAKMLDSLDQMNDAGQAGTPENNRGWNLLRAWLGPLPTDPQPADVVTAPPSAAVPVETPSAAVVAAPVAETAPAIVETAPAVTETSPVAVETAPAIVEQSPPAAAETPAVVQTVPATVESTSTPVVQQAAVPVTPETSATTGESSCTSVISEQGIAFHCKVGQHAAIITGDKIRLMMTPGTR